MLGGFQEKLQSMFEIKIKEDKICAVFKALEVKINLLQQRVQSLSKEKLQKGIFNGNEEETKVIINQLIFKAIHPLQQSNQEHEQTIKTLNYNHHNLCSNMGGEFKTLSANLQEFQNQTKIRITQEEIKTQKEFQDQKALIEKNQNIFHKFTLDNAKKDQEYQFQIDRLWETVKDIQNNISPFDSHRKQEKKPFGLKTNEGKVVNQSENETRSFKMKGYGRQPALKQQIHSKNQDKAVEYASLLVKIEVLESKFKQCSSVQKDIQRSLGEKPKKEAKNSLHNIIQTIEQQNSPSVDKKKNNSPTPSRFSRNSIRGGSNQPQPSQFKPEKQKEVKGSQIKRLSDKLNDLKNKYGVLQQNNEIVLNKIAKVSQLQSTFELKLEEMEKLKVDSSTINEINMRFRKIQLANEEQQHRNISKQLYLKQMKTIKQNIKELQSFSSKMPKHDQIKQAFQFIETKIKEIVIVLTDKFEADQEGAINKIQQIKCLTCDKEVDHHQSNNRISSTFHLSRNSNMRKMRKTYKKIKTQQAVQHNSLS